MSIENAHPDLTTTIYHVTSGPARMFKADANFAVRAHPKEWRREPWPDPRGLPTDPAGPST